MYNSGMPDTQAGDTEDHENPLRHHRRLQKQAISPASKSAPSFISPLHGVGLTCMLCTIGTAGRAGPNAAREMETGIIL